MKFLIILCLSLMCVENTFALIRITYDYSLLTDSLLRNYLQNDLIPVVQSYVNAAVDVKVPVNGILRSNESDGTCGSVAIPTIYNTNGIANTDLLIIFNSDSTVPELMVATINCQRDLNTKRQVISVINIRSNIVILTNNTISKRIVFEDHIVTLIHEHFHLLGVHKRHVEFYRQENGSPYIYPPTTTQVIGNAIVPIVNVTSIKNKMRTFFNCPTINGIPWEGYENQTNHLEKKYFYWEFMSQKAYSGRRISILSLGLLEATGWYNINYNMKDFYTWGENAGCPFLFEQCADREPLYDGEESCSQEGSLVIDYFGRFGANCTSADDYIKPCSVQKPNNVLDCQNIDNILAPDSTKRLQSHGRRFIEDVNNTAFLGNLSINVDSTRLFSYCFRSKCFKNVTTNALYLEVKIGERFFNCTSKGQLLDYRETTQRFYGSIICPDIEHHCTRGGGVQYCPRGCMGRGTCTDNKCVCNSGYKGYDCSLRVNSTIWANNEV
jgi:hypothetical protein